MSPTRAHVALWAVLLTVAVTVVVVPVTTGWPRVGPWRQLYGGTTVLLSVVWVAAMRVNRPPGWGWPVMTLALCLWSAGDLTNRISVSAAQPIYLGAYVTTSVALIWLLVRSRRLVPKVALLDMAIAAVAVATCVGALVIHPGVEEHRPALVSVQTLPLAVAEVGFLVLVIQLWAAFPVRNRALRLFLLAASCYVVSDIANRGALAIPASSDALDSVLQLTLVLGVAAGIDPSCVEIGRGRPLVGRPTPIREVGLMAAATTVIGITLVIDGLTRQARAWPFVAAGIVVAGALITWRVWQLLDTVQRQADEMARAAALDPLTGLANRRVWDAALADGPNHPHGTQWVAVLDLDQFKIFNDDHGHAAGDRLLQQTASAWGEHLREDCLLARIGGEEFGLYVRGRDEAAVRDLVETLRALLPAGSTCSVGLARQAPGETLVQTQLRADEALYRAKADGRDRTVLDRTSPDPAEL